MYGFCYFTVYLKKEWVIVFYPMIFFSLPLIGGNFCRKFNRVKPGLFTGQINTYMDAVAVIPVGLFPPVVFDRNNWNSDHKTTFSLPHIQGSSPIYCKFEPQKV
jgi:hypothetical protein